MKQANNDNILFWPSDWIILDKAPYSRCPCKPRYPGPRYYGALHCNIHLIIMAPIRYLVGWNKRFQNLIGVTWLITEHTNKSRIRNSYNTFEDMTL